MIAYLPPVYFVLIDLLRMPIRKLGMSLLGSVIIFRTGLNTETSLNSLVDQVHL